MRKALLVGMAVVVVLLVALVALVAAMETVCQSPTRDQRVFSERVCQSNARSAANLRLVGEGLARNVGLGR